MPILMDTMCWATDSYLDLGESCVFYSVLFNYACDTNVRYDSNPHFKRNVESAFLPVLSVVYALTSSLHERRTP